MLKINATQYRARAGAFPTVHGEILTPCFMNVGTQAAIKGGLSSLDLEQIGCQVELSNTYHLHLRPGDGIIKQMGGLHKFMSWQEPILTDSGGFQVFSLAKLNNISEDGVTFSSHIDGKKIHMTPELSIEIQSNLASTIAMAFDECVENPAPEEYIAESSARTIRWLARCKKEMLYRNSLPETINPHQQLWGINQGGTNKTIRIENMQAIVEQNLDGYAIGGLAVGESEAEMLDIIETVEPHMPADKPRYLMGVGTPENIIDAVRSGIDFFDCVMPTRNARHGKLFTSFGAINILNQQYELDNSPIDEKCSCPACSHFTRSYLRHLFKAKEILGPRLATLHNLYFYNSLMKSIRSSIINQTFDSFTISNAYDNKY